MRARDVETGRVLTLEQCSYKKWEREGMGIKIRKGLTKNWFFPSSMTFHTLLVLPLKSMMIIIKIIIIINPIPLPL